MSKSDGRDKFGRKPPRFYDVGYGKPPTVNRFQPGQSGNPLGRPRGAKNKAPPAPHRSLEEIILREMSRKISTVEGGQQTQISMKEAIVRSMVVQAVKGNVRAAKMVIALTKSYDDESRDLDREYFKTMIEYKTWWTKELKARREAGLEPPELVPHPDDILIDWINAEVYINGPSIKDDVPKWEKWRERKRETKKQVEFWERALRIVRDPVIREGVERELQYELRELALISRVVRDT